MRYLIKRDSLPLFSPASFYPNNLQMHLIVCESLVFAQKLLFSPFPSLSHSLSHSLACINKNTLFTREFQQIKKHKREAGNGMNWMRETQSKAKCLNLQFSMLIVEQITKIFSIQSSSHFIVAKVELKKKIILEL